MRTVILLNAQLHKVTTFRDDAILKGSVIRIPTTILRRFAKLNALLFGPSHVESQLNSVAESGLLTDVRRTSGVAGDAVAAGVRAEGAAVGPRVAHARVRVVRVLAALF